MNKPQAPQSPQRLCLGCGRPLYGRSNKKHCNDRCKNKRHNDGRNPQSTKALQQRTIDNNYRILQKLSRQHAWSLNAIPPAVLAYEGFRHEFLTSQSVGQGWPGGIRWVYDMGLEKGPTGTYRLYNAEHHTRVKKRQ